MDKEVNNNGYEYVDLGLPSGTLWATMNVGASKPSDAGQYFQWGDTQGYTASQVGTGEGKKEFASDWSDCKWYDTDKKTFTKYTIYGEMLELKDDAAHVHMGGDWHMPTTEQILELINNTTSTWTTQDGVNGRLFTSKSDPSKSIFIPAAGDALDGSVRSSGGSGYVWSSMLYTGDVGDGQSLYFGSGDASLGGSDRYYGLSVRGVIDKKLDKPKEKKSDMDRNENLDLREILKDAPNGLELWSYACGTCYFQQIVKYTDYPIECKTSTNDGKIQTIGFTKEGKRDTIYSNGQCVLFPSKDNRDWSTFKVPKKHKEFKPFEKVLVEVITKTFPQIIRKWFPDIYLFFDEENSCHRVAIYNYIYNDGNIIPFEGNEDKVGKVVE